MDKPWSRKNGVPGHSQTGFSKAQTPLNTIPGIPGVQQSHTACSDLTFSDCVISFLLFRHANRSAFALAQLNHLGKSVACKILPLQIRTIQVQILGFSSDRPIDKQPVFVIGKKHPLWSRPHNHLSVIPIPKDVFNMPMAGRNVCNGLDQWSVLASFVFAPFSLVFDLPCLKLAWED